MNAERWALPLVCLVLLAGLPAPTLAQSVGEQADRAVQKAAGVAEDAAQDPHAAAGNATNASWQGRQVNWTETWSCRSAHAADERAGDAAEKALDCAPPSARAGEERDPTEEEANRTQAEAEEAEADTERAARDVLAAAEALLAGTSEEPKQAPSHVATFANRTLAILSDLLEDLLGLASLPVQAASLAGEGLASGLRAALDGARAGLGGLAGAATSLGQGLQVGADALLAAGTGSMSALAEAGQAGLDAADAGLGALTELVRGEPEASEEHELVDEPRAEPDAEPALEGALELPEPS